MACCSTNAIATLLSARSTGAGSTSTVTVAARASLRRTELSTTPTVT
jgi:hypothetical protein